MYSGEAKQELRDQTTPCTDIFSHLDVSSTEVTKENARLANLIKAEASVFLQLEVQLNKNAPTLGL